MIGQYLSNTNEIGTIHILQNIFETKQGLREKLQTTMEVNTAMITMAASSRLPKKVLGSPHMAIENRPCHHVEKQHRWRLHQGNQARSMGFITRDLFECPVVVESGMTGQLHDALMAEALACTKALESDDEHGISRI